MKSLQKLLVESTSSSLIDFQSHLKQEVSELNTLFYSKGNLTSIVTDPFNEKAQLIVMGKVFTVENLTSLLALLAAEKIDIIQVCAPELIEHTSVIRLVLSNYPVDLKNVLDNFSQKNGLDFALMEQFPNWQEPGLVLMDMDSTTIQIECIDEIAALYGVGEQVSEVTKLAMQGKLDFNESLRTRVSKLKGAPVSILQEVADNMPLMPGLQALITGLKKAGWKVAIASGGFTYFADRLKADLGFDYTIANSLIIEKGKLVGEVAGEIINADIKARTLRELANKYNLPLSQTVAIGDGANDLVMMQASAMGIAIHAKPIVQEKAPVSLNFLDLEGALAILTASNSNKSWF